MNRCERGAAPELVARYGAEIGSEYGRRRAENRSHHFRWPKREGRSVYDEALAAVSAMTQEHCAYCDGHPLDATGEAQIDHFRPKSREEFYHLVCAWENLFLGCQRCNKAKGEQWEEALLRPDAEDFSFLRFFTYRSDTGELEPNLAAPEADQHRARRTIAILDLNRYGACCSRRKAMTAFNAGTTDPDWGYRFLRALL